MKCSLRRNHVTFAKFDLSEGEQTLGSANDNTIKVRSSTVSSHHATLVQRDKKVFLRDLDSTNGTVVNGDEIKGEKELHDADIVLIGDISFTFHAPDLPKAPGARRRSAPADRPAAASPRKGGKFLDVLCSLWKAALVVAFIGALALGLKKRFGTHADGNDVDTPPTPPAAAKPARQPADPSQPPPPQPAQTDDNAFQGFEPATAAQRTGQPSPFDQTALTPADQQQAPPPGQPQEMTKAAADYQKQIDAIESEYQGKVETLLTQYGAYLEKLQKRIMATGDYDGTVAVKEELDAFQSAADKATYFSSTQYYTPRPNTPRDLAQARDYCVKKMAEAKALREKKLRVARQSYSQVLLELQKRLTMAGDLDGAGAVKAQREMLVY